LISSPPHIYLKEAGVKKRMKGLAVLMLVFAAAVPALATGESPEQGAKGAGSREYDAGDLVSWGLLGGGVTAASAILVPALFSALFPDSHGPLGFWVGAGIGVGVSLAVPLRKAPAPMRRKAVLASMAGSVCGLLIAGVMYGLYSR
jgi:hypothetical protein